MSQFVMDAPAVGIGQTQESGQYLSFLSGGEDYAIDILAVKEIKGYSGITPLPHTPPHVKGIINLRGTVVPVVDLRMRLGGASTEYTKLSVIVLVQFGAKIVGLVVDAVSDVLTLDPKDIQPSPDLPGGTDTRMIEGISTSGDKMVVLLDIENLLREDLESAMSEASRP